MNRSRDDFSKEIIRALQDRAGNHCSNPRCRCLTSGPNDLPTKSSRIGVAAHITAAAPDGPRYDASLTPAERSSIQNGIRLCQSCSRLIDTDPTYYPTNILVQWRMTAEQWARKHLEDGTKFPTENQNHNKPEEHSYIEYRIDEHSIKILHRRQIYRDTLLFYISFLPPIIVLVAHHYDILLLLGIKIELALGLATGITMVGAMLTNTQRKIAATTFPTDTAMFIEGQWIEEVNKEEYIQYTKTAPCIYPKCSGTVFIRPAPVRELPNHTLVGVCNIGGHRHTYTVDYNGIGFRQQFDWRAPEKQTP